MLLHTHSAKAEETVYGIKAFSQSFAILYGSKRLLVMPELSWSLSWVYALHRFEITVHRLPSSETPSNSPASYTCNIAVASWSDPSTSQLARGFGITGLPLCVTVILCSLTHQSARLQQFTDTFGVAYAQKSLLVCLQKR